ncbi:MAG: hypothetical protein IIA05_12185 [Proteobacteria bacterium]|nr:hypothetical protein [Pseudomonadota bacterium]
MRILIAGDLYVVHDSVIVPISAICKILDCVLVDSHTHGAERTLGRVVAG